MLRTLSAVCVGVLACAAVAAPKSPKPIVPSWRSLPNVKPVGTIDWTGSYIVADRSKAVWKRPKFVYNEQAATGRKTAKVIVINYDPVLKSEGGKRLTEYLHAVDALEMSHILADVVREASWGYINYEIVDYLHIDGFTKKTDGFRYTEDTFMADRKTQKWQPATTSYRSVIEENHLMDRIKKEGITEIWLWGAGGMAWDEFAYYMPNRYARFGPTDNPWLYRPYDIPPELGKTFWVMGFNYECGPDNMIHSYAHRIESMALLAMSDGIWDTHEKRDPWNVFSWLELDHPNTPSMVGNCHVPPNGQGGYDYGNKRHTLSWADNWTRYPDLRGAEPRAMYAEEWGNSQFGYMKWLLERVPKFPGYTKYGYNNWWLYIANTDEDLPAYKMQELKEFRLPKGFPAPAPRPKQ